MWPSQPDIDRIPHRSYHSWVSACKLEDGNRRCDVCGLYSSVVEYLCCDWRTLSLDIDALSRLSDLYILSIPQDRIGNSRQKCNHRFEHDAVTKLSTGLLLCCDWSSGHPTAAAKNRYSRPPLGLPVAAIDGYSFSPLWDWPRWYP